MRVLCEALLCLWCIGVVSRSDLSIQSLLPSVTLEDRLTNWKIG